MNEPIATMFLLLATFGVSLWAFENEHVERKLIFRPENILAGKEHYRLITSAFLHGGWAHLLLNMYTLYHFGQGVEWHYGRGHFLLIYLGSVLGGNLLSLYVHRHHDYSAYGASGGVCGLIFAWILRFPEQRLVLFPLPYGVPGWLFAFLFAIASFYAMKVQMDNIGHDAHLGGAIIGLLIASMLRPDLVQRNWMPLALLLLTAGAILAYLWVNPLFLPLSSFLQVRSRRAARPPRRKTSHRTIARHTSLPQAAALQGNMTEKDWLLDQIEEQVGRLRKDETGAHDWRDKFDRAYAVVRGEAASFAVDEFKRAVLDRLNDSSVHFVIVDTRLLDERQEAQVRPFIADLPDAQFNRVLRSYAFKPRA